MAVCISEQLTPALQQAWACSLTAGSRVIREHPLRCWPLPPTPAVCTSAPAQVDGEAGIHKRVTRIRDFQEVVAHAGLGLLVIQLVGVGVGVSLPLSNFSTWVRSLLWSVVGVLSCSPPTPGEVMKQVRGQPGQLSETLFQNSR